MKQFTHLRDAVLEISNYMVTCHGGFGSCNPILEQLNLEVKFVPCLHFLQCISILPSTKFGLSCNLVLQPPNSHFAMPFSLKFMVEHSNCVTFFYSFAPFSLSEFLFNLSLSLIWNHHLRRVVIKAQTQLGKKKLVYVC